MKKILNINYNMNVGGIEEFLMNTYRNLDKSKYQVIFLCYEKNQYYEKEIIETGSKIFYIDSPKKARFFRYIKTLKKIIKEEKVDIIHINTYYNSIYPLICAWISSVKKRIVHSHSSWEATNIFRKVYWFFCKIVINILATDKLACSKEAGKKLFFGNFKIVPNGIKVEKFKFNEKERTNIRSKYEIKNNDIILGHVGRLDKVKNHIFILELLIILIKINPNYKVMFVGEGEERTNIEKFIKENNLENNVILTGNQAEAYKFYNAFDMFLFPSKFEGLGIVLVEAQINGLICLSNFNVPNEVNETGNVKFLPLDINTWAKEINRENFKRNSVDSYLKTSNYNIENTIRIMKEIYK